MKIGVFIKSTTFHKGFGGLQTQNKGLCEELVKRGHIVTVFSPKLELQEDEREEEGVKYVFISCQYKSYLFAKFNKDSWTIKSLEVFKKFHSKSPFDLVISQSSAGETIILNKKSLKIATIAISHGTTLSEFKTFLSNMSFPKDFLKLILNTQYFLRQYFGRQRRFVLGAGKVIAVSDIVKKSLMEETFIPEERVEVVYNGVDENYINSIEGERGDGSVVNLIYVGRIEKSKGVFLVIDMVEEMNLSNFKLLFVGGGEGLANLKERVSNSKIKGKVEFIENATREKVISMLKFSDILVFPTLRVEGFPMVLVEAMFCSLPIVAFDMGGVKYGVRDSKTGFLINSGDKEAFKYNLSKLANNPDLREVLGKNGREWAKNDFSIDKMVDKYESVFKEVLS